MEVGRKKTREEKSSYAFVAIESGKAVLLLKLHRRAFNMSPSLP
jgi:hypothetical protein